MTSSPESWHRVNYATPRSFGTTLKANLKETFFPDDPFHQFKNEPVSCRFLKWTQYFVPIFEWLPKYSFELFKYDILAGITIASLAIPQGISYAKLANIPPIIGLYSSFVPPLIYAVFGSSKHLAVGTVAACSLLIAATIEEKVSANDNMPLYLSLVFTATLFAGLVQTSLGLLRLGILIDFLSHSTITGFMGGTAIIICLQQLKGMLGLKHFSTHTDVVSVLRAIFQNRKEWKWESAVVGIIFLIFLQFTRFVKNKKPKLFWVSAIAPMVTIIVGCLFAYFSHADKHDIQIVGHLSKGINPSSIHLLNFDPTYISAPIKAGVITAMISLAEGIAIGRSFSIIRNEQIDGNKEMIAIGLMNIFGSFASCYLTTGPFSRTAVNFNAGCKTAMPNVAGLALIRALLYVARPTTCKLGNIPETGLYRDVEQYPGAHGNPGILILQLGSPIYFANCNYIRERILRWIRDEHSLSNSKGNEIEYLLLELGGITSIDITGVEMLLEIQRCVEAKGIKMILVNPRLGVLEKLMVTKSINTVGKEYVFLTIDDAIDACKFSLKCSDQ